jgi:hypothetical protein
MSQALIRAAKEEKVKRIMREHYRRNPMDWLKDKLGESTSSFLWDATDKEAYGKHEWDGDRNPLFQAWQSIADSYACTADGGVPPHRIVGVEAATGTGKTYMLARIVYWFLDCFPRSLVVTTAPTQPQLKLGVWSEISKLMHRIKKAHPKAGLYSMRLMMEDKIAQFRSSTAEYEEDFFDGWQAVAYVTGSGADEVSAVKARGLHREFMLILLEEASGMSNAIVNAFQNTCTGQYNYIFAVGNPNNKSDSLNVLVSQANTKHFRVSAYDHPNIVLQKELISGAVTQASINDRKSVYGEDSRLYQAMVRGICPDQAFNALINSKWLDDAVFADIPDDSSENAAGVDVAASENGDKGAIAYGKRNRLKHIQEFSCPSASHLAYNLMGKMATYNIPTLLDYNVMPEYVGIDSVGVGTATVETFNDNGYDVTALSGGQWKETIPSDRFSGEPMWRFLNLRSQMYYKLREDLRLGLIALDIADKTVLYSLRRELLAINYTSDTSISIESKEAIKRKLGGKSPNMADALAYWNWVRNGYRVHTGYALPIMGGR